MSHRICVISRMNPMKICTLIALLMLLGCTSGKKDRGPAYESLSSAVIDGFFNDRTTTRSLLINIKNDTARIYSFIQTMAGFKETIQAVFNVTDTLEIRRMIKNSTFLDTTARTATVNVRYADSIPPDGQSWFEFERESILNGLSIVSSFIMVHPKDDHRCVVYAVKRHSVEVAIFEKHENR